jgi:hypothetical protein
MVTLAASMVRCSPFDPYRGKPQKTGRGWPAHEPEAVAHPRYTEYNCLSSITLVFRCRLLGSSHIRTTVSSRVVGQFEPIFKERLKHRTFHLLNGRITLAFA